MKLRRMLPLVVLAVVTATPTLAQHAALTDAQVREQIVHDSVARYLATGHPCACPYNTMRNGRQCGNVSAPPRHPALLAQRASR